MKGKIIASLVLTLLIVSAVLPVLGIRNDFKTTNMENSGPRDEGLTTEVYQQYGRENDYDWQIISHNVITGHGGSYPTGNVGIGTKSPSETLDVAGTARMTGFKMPTGASDGYVLTSDDSGVGTWQKAAGGSIGGSGTTNYITKFTDTTTIGNSVIYENDGKIGVGTTSPLAKLDVEVYSGGAATIGDSSNQAIGKCAIAMGYGTNASGYYSTAMGDGTTASGYGSTAMGDGTTASGTFSIAIGELSSASGETSTAMGYNTWADGSFSTAMGEGTTASGGGSTAMGYDTIASGGGSTAMGYRTTASGSVSTAMGVGTTASDYCSTAMGFGTIASGLGSTAMGFETIASAGGSTAMGIGTIASGTGSTAMGLDTITSGLGSTAMGQRIIVAGDVSVGIGLDNTEYTVTTDNVMSIMGGNVGIGTTNPNYLLDVYGNGIVAQFSGRVKGGQALYDDEFVTKAQVKSVVTSQFTPTSTSDISGDVGDTAWDNNYFYVKTPDGWKRAALETWETPESLTK